MSHDIRFITCVNTDINICKLLYRTEQNRTESLFVDLYIHVYIFVIMTSPARIFSVSYWCPNGVKQRMYPVHEKTRVVWCRNLSVNAGSYFLQVVLYIIYKYLCVLLKIKLRKNSELLQNTINKIFQIF